MSVVAKVQHTIMVFEQRYSKRSQYVVLCCKHREYNFKGNLCFTIKEEEIEVFIFFFFPLAVFFELDLGEVKYNKRELLGWSV